MKLNNTWFSLGLYQRGVIEGWRRDRKRFTSRVIALSNDQTDDQTDDDIDDQKRLVSSKNLSIVVLDQHEHYQYYIMDIQIGHYSSSTGSGWVRLYW